MQHTTAQMFCNFYHEPIYTGSWIDNIICEAVLYAYYSISKNCLLQSSQHITVSLFQIETMIKLITSSYSTYNEKHLTTNYHSLWDNTHFTIKLHFV